ncbi:hypothetical protein SBBP2_1390016 [Burkholderiales bacterium]|nr:hypothetical protein SBBP2_1390016 [Burkholderiales bacterium]
MQKYSLTVFATTANELVKSCSPWDRERSLLRLFCKRWLGHVKFDRTWIWRNAIFVVANGFYPDTCSNNKIQPTVSIVTQLSASQGGGFEDA